ncbi:MAG: class II fumarate hydratase [Candidatus Ancillula sp.]|jgi:fumarate hydratase class II|nr:class II fumarate hydratase [Candidatus Ancillula sp.]
MSGFRSKFDSLGEVMTPYSALWGCTTARAKNNFKIGSEKMPLQIVYALVKIKQASANVNHELGLLDVERRNAIVKAADEILNGEHDDHFPLPVWQTGSGTATNMNVNEVIATLCEQNGIETHPNEHVNLGQSSNDTFSAALHIACFEFFNDHFRAPVLKLVESFQSFKDEFGDVVKIGRTHLMDATPLTIGNEVSAWIEAIKRQLTAIESSANDMKLLALGGTAVGSGINTHPDFGAKVCRILGFEQDTNLYYQISNKDTLARFSSALEVLSLSLIKIANDIRWYASGPRCGISELSIPANEPGSSIMPGKVNPTQIEALTQVCAQVIGNNATVKFAASQSNFQLNTYMPLIGYNVLQSERLLADAISSFDKHLVQGLKVNADIVKKHLEASLMLVTALVPLIGYDLSAKISQEAHLSGRSLKEVALEMTELSEAELDRALDAHSML